MERPEIVDRYLSALGVAPREPSLDLLADIVRNHVARLPFSSIGPRLGDELPLDLESLFERIVVRGRGGYCFEQNGLLFEALEELGFDVRLQLARVIHNQDIHPGLTHRITLVELDDASYVADVGFGPLGPPCPVRMGAATAHGADGKFVVTETRPGELHMRTIVDGEPYSLYRFDLARYGQADCELGHFYSHRHPDATFVNNLVASQILDDEVRSLRNRDYRVLRTDGDRQHSIRDDVELGSILESEFGLQVSDDECRRLFAALPQG